MDSVYVRLLEAVLPSGDLRMMIRLDPYTPEEMFTAFSKKDSSIGKHLLIIYSLAVGVNAQRALDLGIGDTTQALRAAMQVTGGKLFSCDMDHQRFSTLLNQIDSQWELYLEPSDSFMKKMSPPFDFILHDAAHDYWQLRQDLKLMIPMMRQFGLVCIHDTQHSDIGGQMTQAIREECKDRQVSWVHLPFSYGMTILRVEESKYPALISPWGNSRGGETCCWPESMTPKIENSDEHKQNGLSWVIWKMRRIRQLLKK